MRHSIAPNRASYASQSTGSQAVVTAKLLEKKKEYDAVAALERASTQYLQRLEGLAEDCEVMADAGQGMLHLKEVKNILIFDAKPLERYWSNGQRCLRL
jgi:hypothetical protein